MIAAATAIVSVAGIAALALLRSPVSEPVQPAPTASISPSPAADPLPAAPASVSAPEATTAPMPMPSMPAGIASTPPRSRAATPSDELPFRFIGRTSSGADASIVLFGRGRTVTLRGPVPLDDEYVVEAVFDDYLVVRHVPTGAGWFLAFAQRRPVAGPPRDPEDSERD